MSLEERMYLDMFGGSHSPDDLGINENTENKKSDVELSELLFESKSDVESDNLSCCDGESNAVHTEDLIRRGVTRKIAADITYECRHLVKQDSERNTNRLRLKSSELPSTSESVAQHLARTGQFVSAGLNDSKDQAKAVNASSVEAEKMLPDGDANQKAKKTKKLKQKLLKAKSKVDPAVSHTDPSQLPFPTMTKASDIYKMFQSKSEGIKGREVLSVEEEDTTNVEKPEAAETALEKTKKSSKFPKFWKHGKTKVKKFKPRREANEPMKDEAKTANEKTSKFNIFKKKKKTPVKPFRKSKAGCSEEQEVGEETMKWYKVKLSATAAVMPTPKDVYRNK